MSNIGDFWRDVCSDYKNCVNCKHKGATFCRRDFEKEDKRAFINLIFLMLMWVAISVVTLHIFCII